LLSLDAMSTMILEGDTIASTKIRVDLYLSYLDISMNDVWPCDLERQLPSYVNYFMIPKSQFHKS
jgi:hypothetical protein